jgi:hypothetical protein
MNKAYKWLVFTLIVCISQNGQAELPLTPKNDDTSSYLDPQCTRLVQYRDNELFSDFNHAINNYEIFSDVLLLAEENQASVDTAYNRFLASGAGEAFAAFAIAIETTALTIRTVVSAVIPPVGLAVDTALKPIETIIGAKELVDKGAEEISYRVLLDSTPYIGATINRILGIAENMVYLDELGNAHKSAKAEFDIQMKRLKSDVSKYKNKLNQEKESNTEINRIQNQINALCSKTIADKSTEEDEKLQQKKAELEAEIERYKKEIGRDELIAEIQRVKKEIAIAERKAENQQREKAIAIAEQKAEMLRLEQEVEAEIAAEMAAEAQSEMIWDVIEGFVEGYAGSNSYPTNNSGSQTQCAQVVAQINQQKNVLPRYDEIGQGAPIRSAIQQSQNWYNNNCR